MISSTTCLHDRPDLGLANAVVSFAGVSTSVFAEPLAMGVATGLMLGKLVGVLGTVTLFFKLGIADLLAQASWGQMIGTAFLCGISLTMSPFIGLLAFDNAEVQDHVKIGIPVGSLGSGLLGAIFPTAYGRRSRPQKT